MTALIDMTNQRFGRLTVLRRAPKQGGRRAYWVCQCECGRQTEISGSQLRSGTQSCGCLWREAMKAANETHGRGSKSLRDRTYKTWLSMKARCENPRSQNYKYYGGRGIEICARWSSNFEEFLADMGDRPEGKSLDRIDPDGDYEPGNCRWATRKEQRVNRRDMAR